MASWFVLTPGQNPNYPTSYTRVQGVPACPGNIKVCAILAEENDDNLPIITNELSQQMLQATQSGQESTQVLLRATS